MRHRIGSLPLIAILAATPAVLSGCNTFALDDGIPNTAPTATVVAERHVPPPGPVARNQTGRYPTFDGPLRAANTQISDAEFTGAEGQMSALAAARSSGAITEAEYNARLAELRALGADHAAAAEAKISGQ